jgi:hypothetical protein
MRVQVKPSDAPLVLEDVVGLDRGMPDRDIRHTDEIETVHALGDLEQTIA